VFIFALVRLIQCRFSAAGLLLVALFVPWEFPDLSDRVAWRFRVNENSYQSQVHGAEMPRFVVFPWDNVNTSLAGGGFRLSAVVFDRDDQIIKPWAQRTPSWNDLADQLTAGASWLAHPASGPTCRRTTRSFGEHFYYVADEC
jgi:hypothetical protein